MTTNYTFRITRYVNGRIDYSTDNAYGYPTRERAVEAARYHADYWKAILHGSIMKTNDGAKVYAETANGDRLLTYYEVI